MFLEESPEQQQLRAELRQYYAELLTDEVRAGLAEGGEGGEAWSQVVRDIGKDGWLGIGWPKRVRWAGPTGHGPVHLLRRTRHAGAPLPFVTINTVGPTIMRFGTDEQKSFFLPQILAGELNSPSATPSPRPAPTWLRCPRGPSATARSTSSTGPRSSPAGPTRPTTSGWPAYRPRRPKHKGISILCVPTRPGLRVVDRPHVGGLTTTQTFYDNVHVPVANRVGDENEGWRMITTQLNHERVGLAARSGLAISLYEDIVEWAATQQTDNGKTLIDQAGCRRIWPSATPSCRPCGCSTGAWRCTWPTASSPARVLVDQGVRNRADH